jgi:hypothetical protein
MAITAASICPNFVITSSEEGIKVWEMDLKKFQFTFTTVSVGKLKRMINCMMVINHKNNKFDVIYSFKTTNRLIPMTRSCIVAPRLET